MPDSLSFWGLDHRFKPKNKIRREYQLFDSYFTDLMSENNLMWEFTLNDKEKKEYAVTNKY